MDHDALLREQIQLIKAQREALERSVYVGLSAAEQVEYDARLRRLRELVQELAMSKAEE